MPIRTGQSMPLFNGGNMYRDWTFVDDIVSGVVAAVDKRLGYEVINIGRGEPVLLAAFVKSLETLAGKKAPLVSEPMMKADVAYTYANIDKAKSLLGYSPTVSVEEGVRRFYEWYKGAVGDPGCVRRRRAAVVGQRPCRESEKYCACNNAASPSRSSR